MTPRLETLPEKKLIGVSINMSVNENKTRQLWQGFMPRRTEIKNKLNADLYSVEIYPPHFFDHFNPGVLFEKWAAVEVTALEEVPAGMHTIIIPKGLYAVFLHKGDASEGPKTYQYIFGHWIPHSEYIADTRPHFAVMGERYKNEDPDSEEDIWIPIKLR